MSALAKLKLISCKRNATVNPVQRRRNKLAGKIAEQIQIATARLDGRVYAPTKLRTVTDSETGERRTVEVTKRIKEWFWTADTGKINLSIRYGAKTLELAKGKNAIEVSSSDELLSVLDTLKTAVEAGELDSQIESASLAVRSSFTK